MRVVGALCATWLADGIDAEHDAGCFLPCRALGVGVEEPHVDRQMRAIIVGQVRLGRREVGDQRSGCGAHGIGFPWRGPPVFGILAEELFKSSTRQSGRRRDPLSRQSSIHIIVDKPHSV